MKLKIFPLSFVFITTNAFCHFSQEDFLKTMQSIQSAQNKAIIARGEAEAILSIKQAEAEGIQKLLDAKATGYKQLFEAYGEDAKSAATMLLIEKLEEIVKLQVEAIKNIKIDKITVWDSRSTDGKGSSTSNFISQFTKSLPALHDIAQLAGLELPEYLGKISPDSLSESHEKTINGVCLK